ncbi:MAG: hypothetical protein EXQ52_16340 [Bryobacterales bacterium]|nr:hypothetical protein [Bryobacterales bacterium]
MPQDEFPEALKGDSELSDLFQKYRHACETPDASANFMPVLWEKIEARQSQLTLFGRSSKALVTCALAASLMMGIYVAMPGNHANPFYTASYVEVLAFDEALHAVEYSEPVHAESVMETQDADFELL